MPLLRMLATPHQLMAPTNGPPECFASVIFGRLASSYVTLSRTDRKQVLQSRGDSLLHSYTEFYAFGSAQTNNRPHYLLGWRHRNVFLLTIWRPVANTNEAAMHAVLIGVPGEIRRGQCVQDI